MSALTCHTTTPRAKRAYTCDACPCPIKPGEMYVSHRGIWDRCHGWETIRICLHCQSVADQLADQLDDDMDEPYSFAETWCMAQYWEGPLDLAGAEHCLSAQAILHRKDVEVRRRLAAYERMLWLGQRWQGMLSLLADSEACDAAIEEADEVLP